MKKRNIILMVILTLITCGIYGLYVWYKIMKEINSLQSDGDSAVVDFLLILITVGLWGIYCFYKYSRKMASLGMEDLSLIVTILGALSFGIIAVIIIQNTINQYIDKTIPCNKEG